MKREDSKENIKSKRFLIQILLVIIIILILFYLGIFKKPCLSDECFEKSLNDCKASQFVKQKNNNLYTYTISRSFTQECSINIKLEKVAPGSDPDIVRLLEGKSMQCKIPKEILTTKNLDNLDNILQYCHGELKEGILELIIKRMYTLVIGNLDDIVEESKKFLSEV